MTTPVYDSYNRGITINTLNAVGSPVQNDGLSSLDNLGRVSAQRSADGWWTQEAFDSVGEVTQSTDSLGNVSYSEYDLDGELIASRDALGRLTKYAYNAMGEQTTVTDYQGNVTSTAYDKVGNTTTVTDPQGNVSTTIYDALDRPTVTVDPLGNRTTMTFDAGGNESTVTDALNHTTTYNYDALNRQTKVTDALGHVSSTAYDKVGNTTAVTDANGHVTSYAYNNANEQTAVTDANNNTATTAYDAAGNQTAVTDALNKVTTYTLNALEQVVTTTDPNGNATQALYDAGGASVGSLDGLNHESLSINDMTGNAIGSVDALGNLTQTQLNSDGETTAVIDPDGNVTKYGYDSMGRQTTVTDPNGNVTTTAYNTLNQVTSVTDGDSRVITYSYDNAGRELGETWKNSSGTTVNTVTYTYDKLGQMLTAGDTNGTITMAYDAQGNETTVTDVWGLTLTYSYDSADRVTQRADSGGGVQTYVYDSANRETSVQFGGSGLTAARADFGYNNRNDMTSVTRSSDVAGTTVIGTTVYGYDPGDRVTAITNKNSSAATISYYDYTYDNADRVSTQTAVSGTYTYNYNYSYDNSNQLLGDGTTTFSYDGNGNQTMAGDTTGTNNQLTNDGTYTYTYDNAGNLKEKSKGASLETWYYGYDNKNRLTSVRETTNGTTNEYTATYTYDVFSDRVETDTWSATPGLVQTRTSYDNGKAWADLTTSNVVETRYLYDPSDNLVARIDVGTGLRQVFTDRLGSVRDVANTSGTVLDHVEYTPYGGIRVETGSTYGGNFLSDGLFEDRIAGTVSADARTELTAIDRWMQIDPITFGAGQSNLYEDVGNDPTNATDPSGLGPDDQVIPNEKEQLVDSATAAKAFPDAFKDKLEPFDLKQFGKATRMLPNDAGEGGIKGAEEVLNQGCVGVFAMYVMSPEDYAKWAKASYDLKMFPNVKGPWLKFEDAKKLRGVTEKDFGDKDKYIVFAVIGDWKEGVKKTDVEMGADKNGMIDKHKYFEQVGPEKGKKIDLPYLRLKPGLIWDFAIYQPSIDRWTEANHGAYAAGLTGWPMEFFTRKTNEIEKGFRDMLGVVDVKTNKTTPGKLHEAVLYYAWIIKG